VGQDIGPDGVGEVGQLRDDPEALLGVMNNGDELVGHGRHGPVFTKEVQGVVGVEPALEVECQVQVEQRHRGHGAVVVAFFLQGEVPSCVGRQVGGATDMVLVVPGDLRLQQRVGGGVVGDFFVGQQGDQAVLQGAEAAFDFAFGLGIGGDAVGRAQRGEGALELGVRVQPVGGGGVAEERQAVGVQTGGRAVELQERTEMGEVSPSGVAGRESAAENFAGVIVEGQDEAGIMLGGPPRVGRGVVLPEFADGGALPAASGFGAAFERGHQLGEVLADIGGHGGAGAKKVELAGQFVGQEREVQRLAVGQTAGQEILCRLRPGSLVIAPGRLGREGGLVVEPLVAQAVELSGADMQALGGGQRVELAGVEGGQNFLNVKSWNTVDELFFFMAGEDRVLPPKPGKFFALSPG